MVPLEVILWVCRCLQIRGWRGSTTTECPYLDTIHRNYLDFDFVKASEDMCKCCSEAVIHAEQPWVHHGDSGVV